MWRIRKVAAGDRNTGKGMKFETEKVLEGSGDHLPAATIAVHDPKTGRYFLGGKKEATCRVVLLTNMCTQERWRSTSQFAKGYENL